MHLTEKQLRLLIQTRDADLQRTFPGHPRDFLRREKARAASSLPADVLTKIEMDRMQERSKLRDVERLFAASQKEVLHLREDLAALHSLPEVSPKDMRIVARDSGKHEATAIVLASDWHAAERVRSEQVGGYNSYDLETFDKRSKRFFANAVKLFHKEAQDVTINNMVLGLLGDLPTGNIHPDISQNTQLGPMSELALVLDTVAGGIHKILADTDDGLTLTVPVIPGNHSRITLEQRVATEHENSLEWLMGYALAREFAGNKRVRFIFRSRC
jgi:hypothetical protein